MAQNWPDKYAIMIDSSPYYGSGDGYFHPSTHAVTTEYENAGPRYLYYLYHPEHSKHLVFPRRDVQSELTLAMGSAAHGIVQTQLTMMKLCHCDCPPGETHTCGWIEVEYIGDEHHVRGRLDFIVDHPKEGPLPVEMKTQNIFAAKKQDVIKHEWDAQFSMALDNLGFSWGILLVMESGWPYNLKEYRVNRNDELLSEIYSKFDHVRESIALNRPPRHCCSLGSNTMKTCPARYECWLSGEDQ